MIYGMPLGFRKDWNETEAGGMPQSLEPLLRGLVQWVNTTAQSSDMGPRY